MSPMRLFDSHAHLDMADRAAPAAPVADMIARAEAAGVIGIVAMAGATTPGEYSKTLEIADRYDWIWAAAGIHPHEATAACPRMLEKLSAALEHPRVVALGEIGLDYHYNFSPPREQRIAFETQLRIAHETSLPVVIHTREAETDTLAILRDGGAEALGGVIHCFTASGEFAEAALALGFYLSFSGIVTFPKAESIREVVRWVPDDRLLAETDTPFLSPVPFRGRPNEPARVARVVEQLAEIREREAEEMAGVTEENARRCFGLDEGEGEFRDSR